MNGCCVNRKGGYPRACTEATCMSLPDGKTCGDCVHILRCLGIGYTSSRENTSCDFFPRRFITAERLEDPPWT